MSSVRLTTFLTRGIPDLPAEVVGFFRCFYAAFLFIALRRHRFEIDDTFVSGDPSLRWDWIQPIATSPELVAALETGLFGLLVLFAIGLFTRVVYPVFALGLTLWILVMIQSDTNIHQWEVAFLTVLCLVPVPWGAALSLDAMIRRWRNRDVASGFSRKDVALHGKRFGYAVWIPGFILGAVWAGAAYTKIEDSGLQWILGGAAKYHWVIDSYQAPVDWGLWVASHHWAAVAMSFMGVALEATFIAACFVRSTLARTLLATFIGGALIAGFYLFHGVLWWTWGLVLVSFAVPWEAVYRVVQRVGSVAVVGRALWVERIARVNVVGRALSGSPGEPAGFAPQGLRTVHALLIIGICLLMVRQWPEGIGRFTSYSNTYASTADFDERNPVKPVNRLMIGYGTLSATEVFRGDREADLLAAAILTLRRGEPLPASYLDEFPNISTQLSERYGDTAARVTLVLETKKFDWSSGRFVVARNDLVGTLNLGSAALEPQDEPQ